MQVDSSILNKISTIKNLPTLPHVLVKLLEVCNKEDVTVAEVARIVETDTALSGKMIKLINSASYGMPIKVESLHHAINCLGIGTVKDIAVASSISQSFQLSRLCPLFNLKVFWWHSLRSATLSRLVAKEAGYPHPGEAFLAGLLHNIGQLVLWINYSEEHSGLLEKSENRSELLLAEEAQHGFTHCDIGAGLLQSWRFPSFLVDAVLYHHEPIDRIMNALPLVKILYVANTLAKKPIKEDGAHELDWQAKELMVISPSRVEELLRQTNAEVGNIAEMMGIEIEAPYDNDAPVSEQDQSKLEALNQEAKGFITATELTTFSDLMESHDEDEILFVIQKGIHTLFDTKDVFFFLYDQKKECLMGKSVRGNVKSMMISDMVISMKIKDSVLVSSLLHEKEMALFLDSSGQEEMLIDRQIISFIGKEGILCLPLLARGEYLGILVLGLDKIEFDHLSQHFLLNFFSRQAALSLYTERIERARLNELIAERATASSDIVRRVVHEINKPLGTIRSCFKTLGSNLEKQNVMNDEISIISKEIDSISHFLEDLTSFSGDTKKNFGLVDVNYLISDVIKMSREFLRKRLGIEVQLDLERFLPKIISEKESIKQILVSLIKNATEAMTEGGTLCIKTRHIYGYIEENTMTEGEELHGYVEILIGDDGVGIPDSIKSQSFDPFVSTNNGNHTSIELSIVHHVLKSMNGSFAFESASGKGTCVKIWLPVKLQE